MTWTALSRSKGQGHQAALVGCTVMDIELVTDPDACMMYIVSPLAELGGVYCGGLQLAINCTIKVFGDFENSLHCFSL